MLKKHCFRAVQTFVMFEFREPKMIGPIELLQLVQPPVKKAGIFRGAK